LTLVFPERKKVKGKKLTQKLVSTNGTNAGYLREIN